MFTITIFFRNLPRDCKGTRLLIIDALIVDLLYKTESFFKFFKQGLVKERGPKVHKLVSYTVSTHDRKIIGAEENVLSKLHCYMIGGKGGTEDLFMYAS